MPSSSSDSLPEDSTTTTTRINVFHQRQKWLRCGLHAVNNLLQQDLATPQEFDQIASSHEALTGKGPLLYRVGLGDYDGNTIIEFLQSRASCQVDFIDRRNAKESIRQQLENRDTNTANKTLKGFLVNVKGKKRWIPSSIYSSRHWYAVVQVRPNEWYTVDSSKDQVEKVDVVLAHLEAIQDDEMLDAHLMAVRGVKKS